MNWVIAEGRLLRRLCTPIEPRDPGSRGVQERPSTFISVLSRHWYAARRSRSIWRPFPTSGLDGAGACAARGKAVRVAAGEKRGRRFTEGIVPQTDAPHDKMKFETLAVHAGRRPETATGSVAPPIYLSTTFERDAHMVPLGGHTYIRESNPMQSLLEDALFPLEGGAGALVFGSGMAAGVSLLQTLPAGFF